MEELVDSLTRGNAGPVKVVLASVVLALAVYQLALIAIGYERVRPAAAGRGGVADAAATEAAADRRG